MYLYAYYCAYTAQNFHKRVRSDVVPREKKKTHYFTNGNLTGHRAAAPRARVHSMENDAKKRIETRVRRARSRIV